MSISIRGSGQSVVRVREYINHFAASSTSLAAVEQGITIWKELMSFGCFIFAASSTSLAAVEQGITIWKELMSFGCSIFAASSTSLAAVEQGITIWKELMSFGCFIPARQLKLMRPW